MFCFCNSADWNLLVRRSRWLVGLIVLAALLFVCKIIYTTYLTYLVKRDYLSTRFVLELVEDFMVEHGEWPKSWYDLEQVNPINDPAWPKNSRTIQEFVTVDFNVDLNELAGQSPDQFQAVRPMEPNELFDDETLRKAAVRSLLKTIRQLTEENNGAVESKKVGVWDQEPILISGMAMRPIEEPDSLAHLWSSDLLAPLVDPSWERRLELVKNPTSRKYPSSLTPPSPQAPPAHLHPPRGISTGHRAESSRLQDSSGAWRVRIGGR